jgi:hypothetical protein
MLTPGKVTPFYTPYNRLQTTLSVACCRWSTSSMKSSSMPICLGLEAAHG